LEFEGFLVKAQEGAELKAVKGKREEDISVAASDIMKATDISTSNITAMISAEGEKVRLVKVSTR
jgi:hypothetical protein